MSRGLRISVSAALVGIALLILAASAPSFAESYRGLYEWATRHGVHGAWAAIWPLQIDVFIAVGELALFVGLARQWDRRGRISAWTVTGLGLAVSIAGNVGHVGSADWTSRLTAAVPPTTAFAALAVGLGVVKRVVAMTAAPEPSTGAAHQTARSAGRKPARSAAAAEILADPVAAATGAAPAANQVGQSGHRGQAKAKPKRRQTKLTKPQQDAAVGALLEIDSEMTRAEMARRTGLAPRTVGRTLDRISDPAANGLL